MSSLTADEVKELRTLAPSETLLVNDKTKQPMEFFIPPHKSDIPAKCAALIHRFGGVVHKKWTAAALVLVDLDARPELSLVPNTAALYALSFLKDSIVSGRLLKPAKYEVDRHEAPASPSKDQGHINKARAKRALQADELDDAPERPSQKAQRARAAMEEPEGEEGAGDEDDVAVATATASGEEVEKAQEWIQMLAKDARVHRNVVIHVLYAFSGQVRPARDFLLHSDSRDKSNRWRHTDDQSLLQGSEDDVENLTKVRNASDVAQRLAWLEGNPVPM